MIRSTHTYAILPISASAYAEIKQKLTEAGYSSDQFQAKDDGELIDMHGLAIQSEGQPLTSSYQDRVRAEKSDLSNKTDKLESFINGSVYPTLPPAEQSRLTRQHLIMQLYEQVLSERIANF